MSVRMGRNKHFYSPSAKEQKIVRDELRAKIKESSNDDVGIVFDRHCCLRVDARFYVSGRLSTKPDVDNMLKFLLDAMTNVAYHDDCQVVELSAMKVSINDPSFAHTSVSVTTLSEATPALDDPTTDIIDLTEE